MLEVLLVPHQACVPALPDVNECLKEPTVCLSGTCTNSPRSFQYLCLPGFALSDNGHCCFGESGVKKYIGLQQEVGDNGGEESGQPEWEAAVSCTDLLTHRGASLH